MKRNKKTEMMKNIIRIVALTMVLLTLAIIPIMMLAG